MSKMTPEFWSNAVPFTGMIKETDFMGFWRGGAGQGSNPEFLRLKTQ